eukprot:CAMPEP_0184870830 /NCGR_PEP_ID=MMETSP0580-20130426/38964_1 /TAXON_ID=1118495 /ORGANISM="Dactyliosolen fragilissimus" /LENGTH=83 /DNA_ID=CAMNT_0027373147 /DNA_START=191 /DNA_END=443 /DNA_ORIENTATION=+
MTKAWEVGMESDFDNSAVSDWEDCEGEGHASDGSCHGEGEDSMRGHRPNGFIMGYDDEVEIGCCECRAEEGDERSLDVHPVSP